MTVHHIGSLHMRPYGQGAVRIPRMVLPDEPSTSQTPPLLRRGASIVMQSVGDMLGSGSAGISAQDVSLELMPISQDGMSDVDAQSLARIAAHPVLESCISVCVGRLDANGSIDIPVGTAHQLSNPGDVALTLIEVRTGAYLDEDDVERL